MAQLTIYLPDDLAEQLRRHARRSRKTMSSYVLELIEAQARPRAWPKAVVDLLTIGKGDLAVPEDPPPVDEDPFV